MNCDDYSRILILDGATGTMLQKYGASGNGNNDWNNIANPEVIARIHREYIAAGADIIETNTFSSNRISQKEYGLSARAAEMAYEGARIARTEADSFNARHSARKVLVAGSIGPTSKSLSLSPDVNDPAARPYTFDEMAEAYQEQIGALVRGGVDLILFETCFDALNVKAGLYAMSVLFPEKDFPVMVSVSVGDRSGRTLTGQTLKAFYHAVSHYPLFSFGLNCSLGAAGLAPLIQEVASFTECRVSCYPNAGLPNELGGYDETPEKMARDMKAMAEAGLLNIAGGCCGTTPEHIRAIAGALQGIPPREIPEAHHRLTVSGLEPVTIDLKENRFTNIGERTNVAGSRKFARLIASGAFEEALSIAAGQIENGAAVIDINMDDAMLDSTREMTAFTRYVSNDPNVAKAALMIDSSHWETLLAGLKNAQGKSIVNSISLKEGEEAFLSKARQIHDLGAAMVVMAFDEEGQATDYERKIQICSRAYRLLTEQAGIPPEDIIFDVNVLSIATGIEEHARYGMDFIEAVRWIKTHLPGALTSGGISNLSFAFRGNNRVREAMHSVFLYHAVEAGLDMAIVNPAMLEVYDNIGPELLQRIEDVLFDRNPEATERLIALAQKIAEESKPQSGSPLPGNADSGTTPAQRVRQALIKGTQNTLREDILKILEEEGSAVRVIEGPLMEAMETVGEYFGQGKMFLPQVVKSAKIMKEAVSILQPYMDEKEEGAGNAKPRIVIATVKGDVHDIGKNITSIVLSCNGFEVTDLGVMVEKEKILDTAEKTGADIIAVSGLITPSLFQMEEICREMTARSMETPLFVGGATTSALHTAVKLAPLYGHVFHGADASACAVMAKRYMMDSRSFMEEEHRKQEEIRKQYAQGRGSQTRCGDPEPGFAVESYIRPEDFSLRSLPVEKLDPDELMQDFDWKLVLLVCGIKDPGSEAAEEVRKEAERLIEEMKADPTFAVMAGAEFYEACEEDDVVLLEKEEEHFELPMLRQENGIRLKDGKSVRLSLADFVPRKSSGAKSVCGLFATSARRGCREDLVGQAVLDAFAEAASCRMDRLVAAALDESVRESTAIIRPAAGYACFPDHSAKKDILSRLKNPGKLGIFLTDSYGMRPDASVCGMVFLHPEACYPDIRFIGQEQYDRYLSRRGWSAEKGKILLGHLLKP